MFARRSSRSTTILTTLVATVLTSVVAGISLVASPAYAANPVTPGNFRGLGFDQCEAPSQTAMSAWIKSSPFRAVGIYISGNSRACRTQANLNPTWVANQLRAGWHLMPITLGPQASCSTRFPRYGASIDPTISSNPYNAYQTAKSQGTLEAERAVAAAKALGISPGSTLFYDIEGFNITYSTACTTSALWFLAYWTNQLHRMGYASGVYSSASSGIKILDNARVTAGNPYRLPDQVWIADWNNSASTYSAYVRSDGWMPYSRAHQYQGGHNETWGGVRINIDRNYLDLRTPTLAGAPAPAPTPTPTPTPAPPPSSSLRDARCTTASINKYAYRRTGPRSASSVLVSLQCLLKQQHRYAPAVTGTWNSATLAGLQSYQRSVRHPVRTYAVRSDWVTLLSAGSSWGTLRTGSRGADVIRLQRALNAATAARLNPTGVFDSTTAAAVATYQRNVGISPTQVVASQTWAAMRAGKW